MVWQGRAGDRSPYADCRLKRKVPTNLNPPATGVNVTVEGVRPEQRKEHMARKFLLISRNW